MMFESVTKLSLVVRGVFPTVVASGRFRFKLLS